MASLVVDAAILTLLVVASRHARSTPTRSNDALRMEAIKGLVFLSEAGPGGGGGGGGNRMKEPPRRADAPGKDAVTVPATRPPDLEQAQAKVDPNPVEQLIVPVKPLASAVDSLPGVIEGPIAPPTTSQGPGTGGGSGGPGGGPGSGPGDGSGLGPGFRRGIGDGAYQVGNGVTMPVLIREVKPQYTTDAMRARLQGSVLVECIVMPDGSVGKVTVLRSLDSMFGLDLEAIKAARQWRFRPSTRRGEPVAAAVTIQLDFVLR
jgi:protein TonB